MVEGSSGKTSKDSKNSTIEKGDFLMISLPNKRKLLSPIPQLRNEISLNIMTKV